MLTATITNVSSTVSIGAGTALPLPSPFDLKTIVGSGTATYVIRVQDMLSQNQRGGGFTVADELQRLVQASIITITFANLAATIAADACGDAVSNES